MKCDFRAATAVRSAKRRIGLNTKRSAKSCGERESRKKEEKKKEDQRNEQRRTEEKKDDCQTGDDCSGKMNSLKVTEVD